MLLLELTSSIPGIASTMMSRSQSTRRQAAGAASEFEVKNSIVLSKMQGRLELSTAPLWVSMKWFR
ncbi:MAG: hypothetical protein ACRCZU_05010 [Selenomonadaceae bacterium]